MFHALIFGIVLVIWSLYMLINRRIILSSGERTGAVVVRTKARYSGGTVLYSLVLNYSVDEKQYEEEVSVWHFMQKFNDGEIVRIVVDIRNPYKVILENDKVEAIAPVIVMLSGIILLILSFLLG